MSAEIQRLAVDELDLGLAGELAAIRNTALDGVPLRESTPESFLLDARDRDGQGPDEALWVARVDGVPVGWSALTLNRYENLEGAKIMGAVHPDHRRRGIGRQLLELAEGATDRPQLRAPAWAGTGGEQAMPALGYRRTGSHEVRRLELHRDQPTTLVQQAAEAAAGYDLERIVGPTPEALLGDLQLLREVINDAPDQGEFEKYPPERIRRYEQWLADQDQTPYTIVARHRATGEPAGLTIVCVYDLQPAIAAQEDTSVVASHRGHRLGLRLKLAMLEWLRAERPDVESVDTWNVPANAPMVAINDALGCEVVAETISFRRTR